MLGTLIRKAAIALGALAILAPAAHAQAPEVHISGNQFVDGSGQPFRLIGTTAAIGASDACVSPHYTEPIRVQSGGYAWGAYDDATLDLLRAWHMNTVRITLNEDCWLGLNPVKRKELSIKVLRGKAAKKAAKSFTKHYRSETVDLVRRAHAKGFVTIIDLHYAAPGKTVAWAQFPLPDRDHAVSYWKSIAKTFKADRSMVFEVYNEPYGDRATWPCLRDGCTIPNSSSESDGPTKGCSAKDCPYGKHAHGKYRTAGMQKLVDTIRKTGATQPLIVPGLNYSSDLSQWLDFKPSDPLNQIAANFHFYFGDESYAEESCATVHCWDTTIAPVAAVVPVATTEFGQFDCRHQAMDAYQTWADAHRVSYLAFGWFVADKPPCGNYEGEQILPALITDYGTGAPSPMGEGYKAHLAALHSAGELP